MKEKDKFEKLQAQKKRQMKDNKRSYEHDNPAKSSPNSRKKTGGASRKGKKKQHSTAKKIGIALMALHGIMSVVFVGTLFAINLLPMKFMILLIILLAALWAIAFATQKRHKRRALPGKILSGFMIILLAFGSFYVGKMNGAFNKVTGGSYKIDSIVVAVLNEDPAETLEDMKDYAFGAQYAVGGDDIKQAITAMNTELDAEIAVTEYTNMQELATALFDGSVKAIIYNEGYTGMLSETVENYEAGVKIIYRHEIKTELETPTVNKEFSITEDAFSVYLSGIDVYGAIETNSRSDVNIIATVNPSTRQILLTTTPRDYYIPIPGVSNGQKDKLTHAGVYGVDASMATLESLYETEIPFYARVNFTSLVEIVNVLGGVDVYSEYAFTTVGGMYVKQGMNHFNGKQALEFARERKNLAAGDNQRGKNQQAVIVAMIKKMISPAMLTQASGIIDSVSGNVETNMTQEQIQALIKMQLNEGGSWSIYSVAATGTGDNNITYSMPGLSTYVMNPNMDSVNEIISLINRVEDGEKLEGSEVAE